MLIHVDLKKQSLVAGEGAEVEVSPEIDATASVNLPHNEKKTKMKRFLGAMEVETIRDYDVIHPGQQLLDLRRLSFFTVWVPYKKQIHFSMGLIQTSLLTWKNRG